MKKYHLLSSILLTVCLIAQLIQIPVYAIDENRALAAVWLRNMNQSGVCADSNGISAEFESGSGSYEIVSNGCKLGVNGDGGNVGFLINPNKNFPEDYSWKFKNSFAWNTFYVDICYWDEGMGGFYFQYDSHSGVKNIFIQCVNSKTWKYARFKLYDARFNGNANGYDCRIVTKDKELFPYANNNSSPEPVYIYWLKIYSDDRYSSFDIEEQTGKPGNVFFEGDDVKFDFAFKNTDGSQYRNMNVTYSVYKPEAKDEYLQWEETIDYGNKGSEPVAYSTQTPIAQKTQMAAFTEKDAADTVTFENLPFGTYVLKVDITADYKTGDGKQQMSGLVDFAYSKKAEPNPHFGTNAHYDDYYYDENKNLQYLYSEKDIDDQIALARDAGFGKVRSTIRWTDVQKTSVSGFSIKSILIYPYKKLSENGMSGLCNLMQSNSLGYGANWDGTNILGDTDEEVAAFANYAKYVAAKLKPYTKYYSLLNEFDMGSATGLSGDHYDMPSDDEYAKLVAAGSDAIKGVQSDAWIVAGEIADDPAWQYDSRWLGKYTWDTRFLKQADKTKFDAVSYHRYDSLMNCGPEHGNLLGFTTVGKSQLQTYAPNAKLWVTEVGWPSRNRPGNYTGKDAFRNTTYEVQANFMARMLAMYASNDPVDMLMFYEFQDDREDPFIFEENFGIIHSKFYRTPWAAKPGYIATAAFNSLTGKTVKSESLAVTPTYGEKYASFTPVVYKLTNDEGQETFCVWSTDKTSDYTVDTGKDYAVVYDIYGNAIDTVSGGIVNVTASADMKYVIGYDYPITEMTAKLNGSKITDLKSVKNGDVLKIHYTQALAEDADSMVICAAYMGEKLVKVFGIDSNAYNGEKVLTAVLDDASLFDTVKVFAWDSRLKPKLGELVLKK